MQLRSRAMLAAMMAEVGSATFGATDAIKALLNTSASPRYQKPYQALNGGLPKVKQNQRKATKLRSKRRARKMGQA